MLFPNLNIFLGYHIVLLEAFNVSYKEKLFA